MIYAFFLLCMLADVWAQDRLRAQRPSFNAVHDASDQRYLADIEYALDNLKKDFSKHQHAMSKHFKMTWSLLEARKQDAVALSDTGTSGNGIDAWCTQVIADLETTTTLLASLKDSLSCYHVFEDSGLADMVASTFNQCVKQQKLMQLIAAEYTHLVADWKSFFSLYDKQKNILSSLYDFYSTLNNWITTTQKNNALLVPNENEILITQTAFVKAGGQYAITRPGTYRLAENIVAIDDSSKAMISIFSSDVVFDLNGKTLRGTQHAESSGIVVDHNLARITIKNGTIRTVGFSGILVLGGVSELHLVDLNILEWGSYGINCSGKTDGIRNPITRCTITQCCVADGGFGQSPVKAGLMLTNCDDCTVIKSGAAGNRSDQVNGQLIGCYMVNSDRCLLSDSFFNDNLTIGCALEQSSGVRFVRCQANSNGTYLSNGAGFCITECRDTLLKECQASLNKGNPMAGIALYGNYATCLDECVAQGNSGSGGGFVVIKEQMTTLNVCHSLANTATTLGYAINGFVLEGGNAITCYGCSASFNQADRDVAGFRLIGQHSTSIKECVSAHNFSSFATASGIAIQSDPVSGRLSTISTIEKNTLFDNHGLTGSFGIIDDAHQASTALVELNNSFNHTIHYQVSYANEFINPLSGSLSGALPYALQEGCFVNLALNP